VVKLSTRADGKSGGCSAAGADQRRSRTIMGAPARPYHGLVKGVLLAGGTASRLHPLTLVTNKHLLPVYDRPMIYHPLQTLRGMGVTEAMVILGGKSVGDIVELLSDGSQFDLDLTYRYQRGALGIAHAIGLAQRFVGDDSFCVVLGDNILRGPDLQSIARDFEASAAEGGTLLYSVPDPERFGVAEFDQAGDVVAFEEKPASPKSDLIPIGVYFLRPSAFEVIQKLVPSDRGSSRSPTFSTITSPKSASSGAATMATGPTQAPSSRYSTPACLPGKRPLREAPGNGRRRLHREHVRPAPIRYRQRRDRRARQADLRRKPGQPGGPGIGPSLARPTSVRGGRHRQSGNRQRARHSSDAVINFAAESHVDRSILDASAFLRTGVLGLHAILEAVRAADAQARHGKPVRLVQVSTDEVYGPASTGASREEDPLNPRSPYSAAKAVGELLARSYGTTYDSTSLSRAARTPTARASILRSSSRCS